MSFFKKIFGSKKPENKPVKNEEKTGLAAYEGLPGMTDLRLKNISLCLEAGFKPARSLPTELNRSIRPTLEIAKRLNAIKALVLWLLVPEENLDNEKIQSYVQANQLDDFLTADEKTILTGARDDQSARNAIGWRFENAWSLAWYFGYKEPKIDGQMMEGVQMEKILMEFTCPIDQNVETWTKECQTRSEKELIEKEDLFYCLHNAVRSAQLGSDTVPDGFDPIANGGVIHERRHALTWMLSKDVGWEETDLSS
jgi:hypothetical protein